MKTTEGKVAVTTGRMEAIELSGLNGPADLSLVEVEKPRPADNEVLIKVKASGVNYAEVELIQSKYPLSRPLPCIMGFEASGVVVELARTNR
jgi:NADPH:quinone reductase